MKDLISRGDALAVVMYSTDKVAGIKNLPAADAVEVVHAKWVEFENSIYDEVFYRCSSCGEDFCFVEGSPADNLYKYCPNCGARMDGE